MKDEIIDRIFKVVAIAVIVIVAVIYVRVNMPMNIVPAPGSHEDRLQRLEAKRDKDYGDISAEFDEQKRQLERVKKDLDGLMKKVGEHRLELVK